jgi:hypothetical protein
MVSEPVIFVPWIWDRSYRVDDEGISECSRAGTPIRCIGWDRLRSLRGLKAHSGDGECICFYLSSDKWRALLGAVWPRWKLRCPEACRLEQERHIHNMRWALWLLPLMPLPVHALGYALHWWMGWPPELAEERAKLDRLVLLNVCLFLPAYWLYDLLYVRRHARKLLMVDRDEA